ncbi:uncharacterized protein LOC143127364 isoform X2 [Alosa pseudoharengus]|uniref:uncharacterized protein LOC143127364 isoform X2 n=1 Tax=Alosa pseudoharengus TaxID=34774 RepID=UPI003F896146
MSLHHRCFLILSRTGVLTLLLLQGVYGADDVIEMRAVVGGSVVLPSEYQRNNVKFAEWIFNSKVTKKIIAGFYGSDVSVNFKSQFTGRLEMNSNNLSLTVKELTKADSGLFSRIYKSKEGVKLKTKMIQLQVYDPTLMVNITKNVTVHQLNNTCTVSLLCNASGPPEVQFSWSGHCRGSGAKLHFSLSPAEGSVTCTCTASEANNQKLVDATIKCDNKTSNNSVKPDVNNTIPPPVLCLNQSALAQPQQTIYQNVGQAQSQPGGSEGDQSLYVPLQRVKMYMRQLQSRTVMGKIVNRLLEAHLEAVLPLSQIGSQKKHSLFKCASKANQMSKDHHPHHHNTPNSWGCTSVKTSPGPTTLHHWRRKLSAACTSCGNSGDQVLHQPS